MSTPTSGPSTGPSTGTDRPDVVVVGAGLLRTGAPSPGAVLGPSVVGTRSSPGCCQPETSQPRSAIGSPVVASSQSSTASSVPSAPNTALPGR